ncbi:hypothetical protein [Azospirillum sp.]|uniref:hypothetical protein n=1 Tax=Azospirillum sp. TaxID=34012 RepID=UPI003D710D79
MSNQTATSPKPKRMTKSQRAGHQASKTFAERQTTLVQPAPAVMLPPLEPFTLGGTGAGFTFSDFAAWALSDLRDNVARGLLAEYLVARALGITPPPRRAWDEADLWLDSTPIHVKASAYIQSWGQESPSRISFSNLRPQRPKILESLYVLCVNTCRSHDAFRPCDLDSWVFYPITGMRIAEIGCSALSLPRVEQEATPVGFTGLHGAVRGLLANVQPSSDASA